MHDLQGALCAIAFGAFVGTLTALSIDSTLHGGWIIGILVGGVVSYAAYDYRTTWWAVKQICSLPLRGIAWVWRGIVRTVRMFIAPEFYRLLGYSYFACFTAATSILPVALFFIGTTSTFWKGGMFKIVLALVVFLSTVFSIADYSGATGRGDEYRQQRLKEVTNDHIWFIRHVNPISLCYYVLRACFFCMLTTVKVARLIHNEMRVFCFFYGAIGATTGYFLGRHSVGILSVSAPLMGAAFGAGLAYCAAVMHARRSAAVLVAD